MDKINWKQKLSSRKFWSCITAVVISLLAFFNPDELTTERVTTLIMAVGALSVYMLAEGIADNGRIIEKPDETDTL